MRTALALVFFLPALGQVWDLTALDWSPDGTYLLLVSEGRLFVGRAPEGRDLRPLYPQFQVEWARFGGADWFVFSCVLPAGYALVRGTLREEAPTVLYTSALPLRWPTVSWDGTRLAFVEDWDRLMVLDLRGGPAELVVGGAWAKATPEFCPSNRGLFFAGFLPRADDASWELFYCDLRSRDLFQLTVDAHFDWCPRVSPDGLWLAFVSTRGGPPDLWVLPLAGGEPFPLTQDPWEDAFPVWSPDGSYLGYASRRPQGWVFLTTGTY